MPYFTMCSTFHAVGGLACMSRRPIPAQIHPSNRRFLERRSAVLLLRMSILPYNEICLQSWCGVWALDQRGTVQSQQ